MVDNLIVFRFNRFCGYEGEIMGRRRKGLTMKKLRKNLFVVLGIPFVIIILVYINNSGVITDVDLDNVISNLITVLPPLLGMLLSLYGLTVYNAKKDILILTNTLLGALLGVFTAYLFNVLYTNNIWLDDVITATFTINDLQFLTVIYCIIIGFLSGMVKTR